MTILLLRQAIEDLEDAIDFYEVQQPGLGSYFEQSFLQDLDRLTYTGGMHPTHFGYHRCLTPNFPYAIYYRVEGESVRVRALVDCRRDPEWIEQHLS